MTGTSESAERADRLLRDYVLGQYRGDYPEVHIAQCEEASVLEFDSGDGSYGCDTGCSYFTLEASIGCPHEKPVDYEYGDFGQISTLIWAIDSGRT